MQSLHVKRKFSNVHLASYGRPKLMCFGESQGFDLMLVSDTIKQLFVYSVQYTLISSVIFVLWLLALFVIITFMVWCLQAVKVQAERNSSSVHSWKCWQLQTRCAVVALLLTVDASLSLLQLKLLLKQGHPFNGLFPGQPRYAGNTKIKPFCILIKQEMMG